MSKKSKLKQPLNVMADDALGVGFTRRKKEKLYTMIEMRPRIEGFSHKNDVSRTVRQAFEAIFIDGREVKAVLVMTTKRDNDTRVILLSSDNKQPEKIIKGLFVAITEQIEFGDEEVLSFDIDPLVGHPTLEEEHLSDIKERINLEKKTATSIEVVVVYKETITVCGHLPRYIHYDFL